jgi:3-hydroxy-9,10-secoandrosta-1,3,5(10)-triene-9,17-dione monooxygenase reductase component
MSIAAQPNPPALPSSRLFRDALSRFATGVTFVTGAPAGEPAGLIVNSFSSVSLEPPLVSISVSRGSLTWSRIRQTGRFGVSILSAESEAFVARVTPPGADRFTGLNWHPGRTGVPLLVDTLATLECRIVAVHPGGDHWIVVGHVEELAVASIDEPLVFFAGRFRVLAGRGDRRRSHRDLARPTRVRKDG